MNSATFARRIFRSAVFAVVFVTGESASAGEVGACCIDAATCLDNQSRSQCVDAGGFWLGAGSTCAQGQADGRCVDPPICPPGAKLEFEYANCNDVNYGCDGADNGWQFLAADGCDVVVCGRSFADDRINNFRSTDSDIYFFTPNATQKYTVCITADFDVAAELLPLNPGVDPCLNIVPAVTALAEAGETTCATALLNAGQGTIVRVLPVDEFGMPLPDGLGPCRTYTFQLMCNAPTLCADANCDGTVTVSDIGFFVIAIAQGEAAWNAQFPGGTAPCGFNANDINGDGFVTVSDIAGFVAAIVNGGCL